MKVCFMNLYLLPEYKLFLNNILTKYTIKAYKGSIQVDVRSCKQKICPHTYRKILVNKFLNDFRNIIVNIHCKNFYGSSQYYFLMYKMNVLHVFFHIYI